MPPLDSLVELSPIAVKASGGFHQYTLASAASSLIACTDKIAETPCIPQDLERPWIMYDLGKQYAYPEGLYAVRIYLMPPAPPSPPSPPPSIPPSFPPFPSPPPPPSPHPSPPPPLTPPMINLCTRGGDRDACWNGPVDYSKNGVCDDGGPNSLYSYCGYGTDYTDCGSRGCSIHIVNGGFEEAKISSQDVVINLGTPDYRVTRGMTQMGQSSFGWSRLDDGAISSYQHERVYYIGREFMSAYTRTPAGQGPPDGSSQAMLAKPGAGVYQEVTVIPGRKYALFIDFAEACRNEMSYSCTLQSGAVGDNVAEVQRDGAYTLCAEDGSTTGTDTVITGGALVGLVKEFNDIQTPEQCMEYVLGLAAAGEQSDGSTISAHHFTWRDHRLEVGSTGAGYDFAQTGCANGPCCHPHKATDGATSEAMLDCTDVKYQIQPKEPFREGTFLYVIKQLSAQHHLEVDLLETNATDMQLVKSTHVSSGSRVTNLFNGIWDTGYACTDRAISSEFTRLRVEIRNYANEATWPWVAFDNIELKEVDSCEDIPAMLARESPPPPLTPPTEPPPEDRRRLQTAPMDSVGSIEVWVSRNQATYGTRAAKVDTDTYTGASIPLRLTEGAAGDPAEGRYVFIRSFESARELRIDGVDVFALPAPTGRRLEANESSLLDSFAPVHKKRSVQREDPPPSTKKERRDSKPKSPGSHHDPVPKYNQSELERFRTKRIDMMRNFTGEVCMHRQKNVSRARFMRRLAAQWWAQLSPDESDVGCMDCMTAQPMNCTAWFAHMWGNAYGTDAMHEKRRKLREQIEEQTKEHKRNLREAFEKTCCRTSRKTGKKECGKQFCNDAVEAKMQPRMAHTLRRLHENPKSETTLSVTELVATDMVAPHLHHDENCRTEEKRKKSGEIECVGSSLIKHMADKYGFSQKDIDAKLDRYGLSIAQLVIAQLKHMATGSGGANNYRSDPVKAEKMAEQRRKEKQENNRRRMEQGETGPPKPRRRVGPRGSWIKKSTVEGRRRLQEAGEDTEPTQIQVAPLGDLRPIKKRNYEFARNQSMAAKRLLRAANLGAAQHGRKPLSQSDILRSVWDAALATDSSLIGRTGSVLGGFGRIAERVREARELMNKPVPEKKPHKRRLAAHETAYLDGVDKLLGGRTPGFQPPDHHIEKYGWITESVDWVYAHKEGGRIASILEDRHEAMYAHVEEHGTLPVGDTDERHHTGYALLDMNVPPSRLGEYIRMLLPRMKNRRKRRLQARNNVKLYDVPRPKQEQQEHSSVIGAFVDAAVGNEDPLQAAWNALQHNDHRSHVRRSLEGLLGGASTVLPTVIGQNRIQNEAQTEPVNPITELARFLIYDVALCYLYPPVNQNAGNFGDGTGIRVHYSDRLCFPARTLLTHARTRSEALAPFHIQVHTPSIFFGCVILLVHSPVCPATHAHVWRGRRTL